MSGSLPSGQDPKRRKEAAPLDRVLRALNHPLRRRILRVLVDGDGSASSISKKLEISLGVVSYHLNQVLAKECNVVELTESIPRRGAIEKIYRLRFEALAEGEVVEWADSDAGPRQMSLEECIIVAVAAMDADFFELPESGWDWSVTTLDAEGWDEVREARGAFNRRVEAAVAGSQERGEEPLQEVVVGVAAFPSLAP